MNVKIKSLSGFNCLKVEMTLLKGYVTLSTKGTVLRNTNLREPAGCLQSCSISILRLLITESTFITSNCWKLTSIKLTTRETIEEINKKMPT